jgi:hypothetical protein
MGEQPRDVEEPNQKRRSRKIAGAGHGRTANRLVPGTVGENWTVLQLLEGVSELERCLHHANRNTPGNESAGLFDMPVSHTPSFTVSGRRAWSTLRPGNIGRQGPYVMRNLPQSIQCAPVLTATFGCAYEPEKHTGDQGRALRAKYERGIYVARCLLRTYQVC